MRVIRRHFLVAAVDPAAASPRTVHVRWKPFLDHVEHAAPRAPGRWTTARPRKGTTRSRGRRAVDAHAERITRVHWFGCAIVAAE